MSRMAGRPLVWRRTDGSAVDLLLRAAEMRCARPDAAARQPQVGRQVSRGASAENNAAPLCAANTARPLMVAGGFQSLSHFARGLARRIEQGSPLSAALTSELPALRGCRPSFGLSCVISNKNRERRPMKYSNGSCAAAESDARRSEMRAPDGSRR